MCYAIASRLKKWNNACKKVAEEIVSNAKYTVTFLTTSAAYKAYTVVRNKT